MIWGTGRATFDQFKHLESPRVRVRDYLAPIADAYAASDLALARAGAMTTSELFAVEYSRRAHSASHGRSRPSNDERRHAPTCRRRSAHRAI